MLATSSPEFCFPDGIQLVTLAEHQLDPMPITNSFVLTTADRTRVYGVCITWMDALSSEVVRRFVGEAVERAPSSEVYAQQAVCLISRVPAFELLAQCCRQLYRLHITHQTMPLRRELVLPVLSARVARPLESTRLTLGGSLIDVPSPGSLEFPLSLATPTDWLLIAKCLDQHNLIAVWSLLLAEQKVLLLSAHTHVLTMVCETLVALLFPFRWEHVYVPVLPSRLAGFLQAPVPFMVGATPDVVTAGSDEIPSDVVQVHLDNNTVLLDQALYSKLRLPSKARRKLMRKLARVCRPPGPVHEPSIAEGDDLEDAPATAADLGASSGSVVGVHGRLVSAFQLPPHPDEEEDLGGYDSDGTEAGEGAGGELSPLLAVRMVKGAFLRFFTSLLEKLPELYVMPPANVSARAVALDFFDEDRLLSSVPEHCREWLGMLLKSQAFAEFVHDRLTNDGSRLDIAWFNESVDAKYNRSRRVFSKRATPLLTTGRLPDGFSSRVPPQPVRAMYARLCAAAGRERPSPSTRLAVLVVGAPPGKGRAANALPIFVEQLRKEFARELLWTRLSDAPSGLVFHTVAWTSVAQQHARAQEMPHALDDSQLREAILELEASASPLSATRERIRAGVLAGLAHLAQLGGAGAPLCVVAQGVGGLVALEVLRELQASAAAPGPVEGADRDARKALLEGLTTPLQRCETLASIATLGVPLAFSAASKLKFKLRVPAAPLHARFANLRGSWLHFFHRDDALGAPIGEICTHAKVRDIECKSRTTSRRSAEATGPLLYLLADAREVVQPLARALSEVWQSTNIVYGGSGEAELSEVERRLQQASVR
mmetsp:Transcript_31206/g.78017  ORF Transcript_31206/g.78017 Transcript_31206/m.78017 type:complete len:827 (-) Transcript_31206:197-2677(-)